MAKEKLTTAERTARNKCGDGKLPNLYWVSTHADYLTNKDNKSNCFDWASERYDDFPDVKGETFGPFKTFEEAKEKMEELANELSDPSDEWEALHSVMMEDRLSGTIFEAGYREFHTKGRFPCVKHEFEWYDDTKYTRERLGDKFK